MKISTVDINRVVPDPDNARLHDDRNIRAIAGSLEKFGQQKPIVVDGDYRVIAGNGTVSAAQSLGWKKIKAVKTELTGDEARAFALADNRTAELAEWDDRILKVQLGELLKVDFDIEAIGFEVPGAEEPPPDNNNERKGREEFDKNSTNDEVDLLMGFKTAMVRDAPSAPMALFEANGLLKGKVLDFGGGMDTHSHPKYDPYYNHDPALLRKQYDTVTCNYVLNVQAHVGARANTLLALRALLRPGGRALISVMSDKDNGGEEALVRSARGFQIYMSKASWEVEIKNIFKFVKRVRASFAAWECSDENIL